jgi:prepilin-type N-terminal cleavage/methylation domain-containing protein
MNTPQTRWTSEAGMTLSEILVAVAILGIAVATIVGGLAQASSSSDRHRKAATADTALKSFAEHIKQKVAVGAYVQCPTTTTSSYASLSGWTAPTGYTVSVDSVKYWNGSSFDAACPTAVPPSTERDQGAQLLKLVAASSDGRASELRS